MSHLPCLTNTQLLLILSGSAPLAEATCSEDHLDECADCRALLVDLVKSLPGSAPGQPA